MSFWAGVFSEPAPTSSPSASRVVMGLFAVAAVSWVTFIVLKTQAVPDLWQIAAFVSSPYLVNQSKAVLTDFKKS